jgi:Mg2+ and Co2+ transporter CorA
MNTINTPIVSGENGWFIIVSIEITVLVIVYLFAKKKKWF